MEAKLGGLQAGLTRAKQEPPPTPATHSASTPSPSATLTSQPAENVDIPANLQGLAPGAASLFGAFWGRGATSLPARPTTAIASHRGPGAIGPATQQASQAVPAYPTAPVPDANAAVFAGAMMPADPSPGFHAAHPTATGPGPGLQAAVATSAMIPAGAFPATIPSPGRPHAAVPTGAMIPASAHPTATGPGPGLQAAVPTGALMPANAHPTATGPSPGLQAVPPGATILVGTLPTATGPNPGLQAAVPTAATILADALPMATSPNPGLQAAVTPAAMIPASAQGPGPCHDAAVTPAAATPAGLGQPDTAAAGRGFGAANPSTHPSAWHFMYRLAMAQDKAGNRTNEGLYQAWKDSNSRDRLLHDFVHRCWRPNENFVENKAPGFQSLFL